MKPSRRKIRRWRKDYRSFYKAFYFTVNVARREPMFIQSIGRGLRVGVDMARGPDWTVIHPYPTLADVAKQPVDVAELIPLVMKTSIFAPFFEMTPDEVDDFLGRPRRT